MKHGRQRIQGNWIRRVLSAMRCDAENQKPADACRVAADCMHYE